MSHTYNLTALRKWGQGIAEISGENGSVFLSVGVLDNNKRVEKGVFICEKQSSKTALNSASEKRGNPGQTDNS